MQHFSYDNGKAHNNKSGWNATKKLKVLAATASAAFMLFATGCAATGTYGVPRPNVPGVPQSSSYGTQIDVGGGRIITVPPVPQGYNPADCTFTFSQSGRIQIDGNGVEKSNNLQERGGWKCRARTYNR